MERRLVGCPEQDVLAGPESDDRIDDLRRSLGQGAHVQGIRDGHAVEPHLPAEQVAQDRGGQAGRQVVALAGQREVAGHDHPCAGVQCRPERDQLALGQLGVRAGHHRQLVVRIRRRVAGSREVLDRRGHAVVLQAANGRGREPSDRHRIVAEAADAEGRIGRVVRHVADRRVVDVDAEGAQLARRRARRRARVNTSSPVAPRAIAPANCVVPSPRAMSWPPSWSAAISNGGAPAGRAPWIAAVSLRTWGGSTMLWARNSVTPATPCSLIRLAADGGSSVPSKAIIRRASVTT